MAPYWELPQSDTGKSPRGQRGRHGAEKRWNVLAGRSDRQKPPRLHTSKISAQGSLQGRLGIQDVWLISPAHKHHPMPEWPPLSQMPFDGEQRAIRQIRPGTKRPRRPRGFDAERCQYTSDMGCLRPQSSILRRNAQGGSNPLCLRVRHPGDHRHCGNATACSFFLHDRLHGSSTFIFRPPEMLNPCCS